MWRNVLITGKIDNKESKTRRRKKDLESENSLETCEEDAKKDMETVEEKIKSTTLSDDGIFKVTIGPSTSESSINTTISEVQIFQPSPRMNCGIAIKHGILYLYGGMREEGSKQITLNDFYALNLKKLEVWRTIIKDNQSHVWLGSDSESDNDDDDDEDEESDEEMDTD